MNIQWYPGHMTKTRRQMEADLKLVDAVCEIVDARIPMSSRNPDIDTICGSKPRIIILNRMDLADPEGTKRWAAYFRSKGMAAIPMDCKNRKGIADFTQKISLELKNIQNEKNNPKEEKKPIDPKLIAIYKDLEEQMKTVLGTPTLRKNLGKNALLIREECHVDRISEKWSQLIDGK